MTDTTEHDPIVGDTPAHLLPDANAIALWCGAAVAAIGWLEVSAREGGARSVAEGAARIADAIVGEFDERFRL